MRKYIFLFIITVLVISCGKKSKPVPPKQQLHMAAMFMRPDSAIDIKDVYRIINDKVIFDSVSGKKKIISDTLWFCPRTINVLDSLKRPMLDSLKNPILRLQYFLTGRDSVEWKIEGKDLDSLAKAKWKK